MLDRRFALWVLPLILVLCCAAQVPAVEPSENLLPSTTKGLLSIPDVDALRSHFDQTQYGHLLNDPLMKPFTQDLERQFNEKLSESGRRVGLTWDDVKEVYGGEVAIGTIQPGGNKDAHALAVLVDITGKMDEAKALLDKITANQAKEGAKKSTKNVGMVELLIFEQPKKEAGDPVEHRVYYIHQNRLIAADHLPTAEGILARMNGNAQEKPLAEVPAFRVAIDRVAQEAGDLAPHLRWFIEPFGYMEVTRARNGGRKRRGTDMLKVLANQGFTAIQGLAGYVNFKTEDHELLHRTMIYAPPVTRPEGDKNTDRYDLAARMLDFPSSKDLVAQPWIPRDLSAYVTVNWKVKEGFEYSKTLVNEMAGDEIFEDVLDSIKSDPNGPKVDIRNGLIKLLGDRISILSDYQVPINANSERLLVAVEATNVQGVEDTIRKLMEADPNAHGQKYEGHQIWEIIEEEADVPEVEIDGLGGLGPIGGFEEPEEEEEEGPPLFPNKAATVAYGHLLVATNVELLKKVLHEMPAAQLLPASVDYQQVTDALVKLGADNDSARMFSRTDEEFRPTYELIRQGKMPESKSILGHLLNRLLGSGDEDEVRKQEIDGSKMPDFDVCRRYLGPAGAVVKSEDNGWLVVGCALAK